MAVRDLATLDAMSETFVAYLSDRGCITQKGKAAAAVKTLLGILDRKSRLIQLLGLERQSRPIHPLEAVRLAVEEANQP